MSQAYLELFVHNQVSDFISQSFSWFCNNLMPEAKYKIVGTYDKAVQRLKQDMNQDVPVIPAVSMNPTNLAIQENKSLLWQHSQTVGVPILNRLYDPIAQTDKWALYPIYQEWQGDLEVLLWLPSIYMQIDKNIRIIDFFGGTGRYVRPEIISSYIILPDTLLVSEYIDPYTDTQYTIDFKDAGASSQLIQTINKNKVVFDQNLTPYYTLSDISDSSEKYGGDDIASWKLSLTLHWKCSFPIWLVLATDKKLSLMSPTSVSGHVYSDQVSDLPKQITINSVIYTYKGTVKYVVDEDTTDPTIPIDIDLDTSHLVVTGPNGYEDFSISDDKTTLTVFDTFEKDSIIDINVYTE